MSTTHALRDEQDDKLRLQRANEHLAYCRNAEVEAIKVLADARERVKRAKEKSEAMFHECEQKAVKRRKSGAIECLAGY